jgi:dCTP deaminase
LVLSKRDILHYINDGRLVIDPAVSPERIKQVSIDLKLGRNFSCFKQPPAYLPAIHVDPSLWSSNDLWEHHEVDTYRLQPGQLVLAQTLERVRIPADLVGFVEGRSSWARVGVTIHVTAPKIDPGFEGRITLEMANFGRVPVDLRAGVDEPAQLMLLRISRPLEELELYGTSARDVFQHQMGTIPRPKKH